MKTVHSAAAAPSGIAAPVNITPPSSAHSNKDGIVDDKEQPPRPPKAEEVSDLELDPNNAPPAPSVEEPEEEEDIEPAYYSGRIPVFKPVSCATRYVDSRLA